MKLNQDILTELTGNGIAVIVTGDTINFHDGNDVMESVPANLAAFNKAANGINSFLNDVVATPDSQDDDDYPLPFDLG